MFNELQYTHTNTEYKEESNLRYKVSIKIQPVLAVTPY